MPERSAVVLVDEAGSRLGLLDKLGAHRAPGRLHLAFSVFVFRGGEVLVQRRAASKYHFPGVWANACCSHPEPGEDLVASARRRLFEELGIDLELFDVGVFVYRAVDSASGLVEHELDHVLVTEAPDGLEPSPAPEEVDEVAWRPIEAVAAAGPDDGYAPWFSRAIELALAGMGVRLDGTAPT